MRRLVNMRLPVDLLARVDERAGCLGQTRTMFVERALESALVTDPGSGEDARVSPARVPASSRAPVEKEPEMSSQSPLVPKAVPASSRRAPSDAMRRQAALNKAKEKT